jgi:bile acid:Na+ symporter, BASS family
MQPLIQFLVSASMFVLMTIIGMELTRTDFRRVLQFPRKILLVCSAQWLGLPLLAGLCGLLFQASATATLGLLVFAACPAGGLSNVLTLYARGNVALSVTVTAVSCLASLAGIPVVIAVAFWWAAIEGHAGVPVLPILAQLLFLVLLPVMLGMRIRAWRPVWVLQHYRMLQRLSLVLLLVVLGVSFGVGDGGSAVGPADIGAGIPMALGFVVGSLLLALATARAGLMSADDAAAVVIEFLVRNGGIMALVILGILQRPELIAVPTACVLLQLLLAPVTVAVLRRWGKKLSFAPAALPAD